MRMREAFSLLVAIFTIVLISLVGAYIFHASSSTVKEGELQYKKEQAMLLARSYTEYAVMAISANDRLLSSSECIDEIRADVGRDPERGMGYRVRVKITYIGSTLYVSKCDHVAAQFSYDVHDNALSAIIDVYVKYREITHPSLYNGNINLAPWKTYHRRSIQKI